MTPPNSQPPESIFRVNVRVKKHKTQGQMLADFSEVENPTLPPIRKVFITHDRGPCPVAWGVRGSVVHRDGDTRDGIQLRSLGCWPHRGGIADIIAYRIERDPNFRVEAGKFYITASGARVGPMNGNTFKWIEGRGTIRYAKWENDGTERYFNPMGSLLALAADQTSPMVSA